jgi:hypothetical protein
MLHVLVLTSALTVGAPRALAATGTSDAGVTPTTMSDAGPGGNVTCAGIGAGVPLISSDRHDWSGGRLQGELPDGIEVVVTDDTSVAWTSTFPISAVIVKGGSAANVYRYDPARLSDAGLTSPVNASGAPAELSNLTFCWQADAPPPPPDDDLSAACLSAAVAADVGPITSLVGPMWIRDGQVVTTTVPSDVELTFDELTQRVGFVAPFPVVIAVTRTSPAVVHRIDPASTTGSVPFSLNPGSGDVVLCGLPAEVVVAASCAPLNPTSEVGPVMIRSGAVMEETVTSGITEVVIHDEEVAFAADVPVIGVLVSASPSALHAFDGPVLSGSIPMVVHAGTDADLMFCVRTVTPTTERPTGGDESEAFVMADPVVVAAGGGPSARVTLALLAFLIVSLVGVSAIALWSRSG